ncbi:MAG: MBL fold metallo-hydrolase [Mycoplasmoidaceae bacterium]
MIKENILNKKTILYQDDSMFNNTIVFLKEGFIIIVDPSFSSEDIFKKYYFDYQIIVILTHSHNDHIGDLELINKYADKIFASKRIIEIINYNNKSNDYYKLFGDMDVFLDNKKLNLIEEGQKEFGFTFLLTPGHSPDSICFYNNEFIITGDHIFIYDIGRTDFLLSNANEMLLSLKKISNLLDHISDRILIPGHHGWENSKYVLKNNLFLTSK